MTEDEKKNLAEGCASRREAGFNRLRKSAKFREIVTVAQTEERPVCNGQDAGSRPAGGTRYELDELLNGMTPKNVHPEY